MARQDQELDTDTWARVFREAAALGVLQLHLSGGEPASRRDLETLVTAAREAGLYTNLITSGIGLTEKRLAALDTAGLDHVQLSLQGTNPEMADEIGGYKGGFRRKMQVAEWIGAIGFPLTLNAVLHRRNLHQLPRALEMAVEMGARRIEVATVQFHGWALKNRDAFMPTREQAREATRIVAEARKSLAGTLVIDYVPADYHEDFPKRCMGGWGTSGLNVAPDGQVLPCHAAQTIKHLSFERVQDKPLADIWYKSTAFNAYRGTDWMAEPCSSCERKTIDFGGCRCQAMAVLGDPAATDPVCVKSPHHKALQRQADGHAAQTDAPLVHRGQPGRIVEPTN
jgi:pyrroloquinoline quinone biosynthesis protein E